MDGDTECCRGPHLKGFLNIVLKLMAILTFCSKINQNFTKGGFDQSLLRNNYGNKITAILTKAFLVEEFQCSGICQCVI